MIQSEQAFAWLAGRLGVSQSELEAALGETECYKRVFIPKRGKRDQGKKKKRALHVPPPTLMRVQRLIHDKILRGFRFPRLMHGFIGNRSHLTAAAWHVGAKALLTIDFKNAFDTVTRDAIYSALMVHLRCSHEIASLLADFASHNGRLPQGAPSSPLIFNLVALSLAKELSRFAEERKYVLTFYADEVAMSASAPICVEDREVVIQMCRARGFRVAPEKVRYQESRWGELELTGLLVRGTRTGLSNRKAVDLVRARIHRALARPGLTGEEIHSLRGSIGWIARVDPAKLKTRLRKGVRAVNEMLYH